MSGKRKADQVESVGLDGGVPSNVSSIQLEKQAKKHITLTHTHPSTSTPHPLPSSTSSPIPPPSLCPSSPRTAPLPAELHTPPALDDSLLASLTLSPLSSNRRTDVLLSFSVPSSPACRWRGGDLLRKRSRHRTAPLPSVPPLSVRPSTEANPALPPPSDSSSLLSPPTPSTITAVPLPTPPTPTVAPSAVSSILLPVCLTASVDVPCPNLPPPSSPVAVSSRSSVIHAFNVDSAIRGMQGISISSLSSIAPLTLPAASPVPNPSPSDTPPSIPSSLSTPPVSAPRPLPLIRLTLNYSGVRRTNSHDSDSAQGNLKKHKRSILSPSPIHVGKSPEKDSPNHPTPTFTSPPSHPHDREGRHRRQRIGDGEGDDGKEDVGDEDEVETRSLCSSLSSEAVGRVSVGGSVGGEDEEEVSIGSIETALSASTPLHLRSPSASTVASSSASTSTTSSTPIRCEICNTTLSSAAQLEDHQQGRRHQHHILMRESGGAFTCELCQKVFTCAADQERHIQGEKHRELMQAMAAKGGEGGVKAPLVLACELCGVTFTGLTQQKQHLEGRKHQLREQRRDEGKEEGGKERRKRDDSKGRDVDPDGLSSSKKRKYGRSSPATLHQQQQPSPTPRRILPGGMSPSAVQGGGRVLQTIRYITPPPPVQPRRSTSRGVRSVGSEGSGGDGVHGEEGPVRRGGLYQPHPLRSVQGVHVHEEADGGLLSYPSGSYEGSPRPYHPYDSTYPSYGGSNESSQYPQPPHFYPPVPPSPYHPPYPFTPLPLGYGRAPPPHPPLPYYPRHGLSGSYLPTSLPPPMYAYLSPSAAEALNGPVLPSLTPITVMYPTELLLSHPFAFPPLYIMTSNSSVGLAGAGEGEEDNQRGQDEMFSDDNKQHPEEERVVRGEERVAVQPNDGAEAQEQEQVQHSTAQQTGAEV